MRFTTENGNQRGTKNIVTKQWNKRGRKQMEINVLLTCRATLLCVLFYDILNCNKTHKSHHLFKYVK